jgi:flagellin-like protein
MPCLRHVQKVFERMAFTKNDEAVSPVIGVILMVAITVILAAVIAAFVFGMAGNVQSTKVVSMTATKNATGYVTVTNMGGSDVATLQTVTVTVGSRDPVSYTTSGPTAIGKAASLVGTAGTAERVLIIGKFSDGAEQILLDKTI